jgi:hypothetical protein
LRLASSPPSLDCPLGNVQRLRQTQQLK